MLSNLLSFQGYGVASYYAVFDGHNGSDAAIYACSHVHQYLVESQHYPHNPEAAFKEAYKRADDRFIDKSNKEVSCFNFSFSTFRFLGFFFHISIEIANNL